MKLKNIISSVFIVICLILCVGCYSNSAKAIELMGAGDRIHDTYTFDNVGVSLRDDGDNKYTIFGKVKKLTDENVKSEFEIASDVDYIVAIKLAAIEEKVVKDEVEIYVNGTRNYDAEHLNGSTYTFILLEAKKDATVSINVKWNKDANEKSYIVYFANDLVLE